jgi:hypothetical protein
MGLPVRGSAPGGYDGVYIWRVGFRLDIIGQWLKALGHTLRNITYHVSVEIWSECRFRLIR